MKMRELSHFAEKYINMQAKKIFWVGEDKRCLITN